MGLCKIKNKKNHFTPIPGPSTAHISSLSFFFFTLNLESHSEGFPFSIFTEDEEEHHRFFVVEEKRCNLYVGASDWSGGNAQTTSI